MIRGNVDLLMKLIAALDALGIELIGDNAAQPRRRPRRAAEEGRERDADPLIARRASRSLLALAPLARRARSLAAAATPIVYGSEPHRVGDAARRRAVRSARRARRRTLALPLGLPSHRRAFPHRCAVRLFPRRRRSRRRRPEPLRARLRPARDRARTACCRSIPAFLAGDEPRGARRRRLRLPAVAWEFMSLTSWALVMAHHRDPENARAGYIYLVMASFGTLALLLAFGLLAGAERRLRLRRDARTRIRGRARRAGAAARARSAPARRPAWCRCMSGCRSRIRRRRAMSRR